MDKKRGGLTSSQIEQSLQLFDEEEEILESSDAESEGKNCVILVQIMIFS
jgi:hypothetical protein